ncbi:MAG: hypothetical protein GF353_14020 [Candidatus Lokiarchaeota archaeon]|nr:hypothetical protein [Candidatus Lokiarchaeota archaeon]
MKEESSTKNKLVKILYDLKTAIEGHVVAYKHLVSTEDPHKLAMVYSKNAEDEWLKIHKKNPEDWLSCHHLAILYHAHAFHLELSGNTKQAVQFWKNAHTYWNKLFKLNEPIDRFHNIVKKMDRYNENEHSEKFNKLKQRIIDDLLSVHSKLYEYYSNQKKIELKQKADYHYELLEKSPFKESHEILEKIYENQYGNKVKKLILNIEKKQSYEDQISFKQDFDVLINEISELNEKKISLTTVLRDLIILASWSIRIRLYQWILDLAKLRKKQSSDEKRFNDLNQQLQISARKIDKLKRKIQGGKHLLSGKHDELVREHNDNVGYLNSLRDRLIRETQNHISKLADLFEYFDSCILYLEKLSTLNDVTSLQRATFALQNAVNEVIIIEKNYRGINEHSVFRELKQECQKLIKKINMYQPKKLQSIEPVDEQQNLNLWELTEISEDENPYHNTSFLLLETELPSIADDIDINNLIKNMKLKKQRILEKRAKAGKYQVLGKKIKHQDLNKAILRLDKPEDLVKDMLLQHQAHHADTNKIKENLSKFELPSPEKIPITFSPTVFFYFSIASLPKKDELKWENDFEEDDEGKQIKPELKWPT